MPAFTVHLCEEPMSKKQTSKGKATGKASHSERKRNLTLRDLDAGGETVKGGTVVLQHETRHASLYPTPKPVSPFAGRDMGIKGE